MSLTSFVVWIKNTIFFSEKYPQHPKVPEDFNINKKIYKNLNNQEFCGERETHKKWYNGTSLLYNNNKKPATRRVWKCTKKRHKMAVSLFIFFFSLSVDGMKHHGRKLYFYFFFVNTSCGVFFIFFFFVFLLFISIIKFVVLWKKEENVENPRRGFILKLMETITTNTFIYSWNFFYFCVLQMRRWWNIEKEKEMVENLNRRSFHDSSLREHRTKIRILFKFRRR